MIKRWGGTVEDMRKLSREDQLRARTFTEVEKHYASYAPKDLIIKPLGNPLPGPDYYVSKSLAEHAH